MPSQPSETVSLSQWLNVTKLPHQYECPSPPPVSDDKDVSPEKIIGSLLGLALGDALGAHVEFRPRAFLLQNPVTKLVGGGTWSLEAGQWTDDTSMALCLAASLITKKDYDPYDQMVRYKWWWKRGYMSSTGKCFDIGNATEQSLSIFNRRQMELFKQLGLSKREEMNARELDVSQEELNYHKFDVNCSGPGVAGNGALMRLSPVPLFFYRSPKLAVEYAGKSGRLTHGDVKAVDCCRYYAALICGTLLGFSKEKLLDKNFYSNMCELGWFGDEPLHDDVLKVAQGSYQNPKGYDGGIRGQGYIVKALEAALWAFWSDEGSFMKGALNAVNLGDDADTTAAIYGQLAGAYYGVKGIPSDWLQQLYAREFISCLGLWLCYEGYEWHKRSLGKAKRANSKESVTPSTNFDERSHRFIPPHSINVAARHQQQRPVNYQQQSYNNNRQMPYQAMQESSPHSLNVKSGAYTGTPPRISEKSPYDYSEQQQQQLRSPFNIRDNPSYHASSPYVASSTRQDNYKMSDNSSYSNAQGHQLNVSSGDYTSTPPRIKEKSPYDYSEQQQQQLRSAFNIHENPYHTSSPYVASNTRQDNYKMSNNSSYSNAQGHRLNVSPGDYTSTPPRIKEKSPYNYSEQQQQQLRSAFNIHENPYHTSSPYVASSTRQDNYKMSNNSSNSNAQDHWLNDSSEDYTSNRPRIRETYVYDYYKQQQQQLRPPFNIHENPYHASSPYVASSTRQDNYTTSDMDSFIF
ncbi:unnamed protein product [Didymodactylos carnosus]|uniref:ADP-ribosylhydrolase ARH3 n=1 Tax=Didymodactylos carnosus TaxID=1234261 RepID=A0A8S2D088_9BILA|nr:unnamed protein product [Didymodactylos carnosus]CAF3592253.1 unnamed protein product [Didymodactylos carnosus]